MTSFNTIIAAQQIIFGTGSLSQLAEAVAGFGWQRLLVCTIPRLQRSGLVDQLAETLGPRLTARYTEAQPHVPQEQVDTAVALAATHDIQAVIGLGGGSAIGLAKAVSAALHKQYQTTGPHPATPTDQPLVPVIAIPTTYSGSEMTPIYGITQAAAGVRRKVTTTDIKTTPKLTLYDPALTLALPPQMTAASGINALAHCVEAVYSITRNPLATAAALQGINHITNALPTAVADGQDIEARTELFLGAYLAATAVATAKIGLHHGLCHVLGGTVGVPHGLANAIMLPHAMRYNADVTTSELAAVARAMGLPGHRDEELAEKVCQAVYDLITRIGLPQRLRAVGVTGDDLPRLAQLALKSKAVQNNPKPITQAAQTEAVYRAAW